MKKLLLIANWKSHKTIYEAHTFMINFLNNEFSEWLHTQKEKTKHIVICPPTLLLPELARSLEHTTFPLAISLGAQDISAFPEGEHTGEVAARELLSLAEYVIVGHSERRGQLGETDEIIAQKIRQALAVGLKPILCVQSKTTPVPEGVSIIAYEPLDAIGSGQPENPERVEAVASYYKDQGILYVLYGGSVTSQNVQNYTALKSIDGVLVGGASLDPKSFASIIQRA